MPPPSISSLPILPRRAAYLTSAHLLPKKRNALSLKVLEDLRDNLHRFNTSPADGKVRLLPPFRPNIIDRLEMASDRLNTPSLSSASKEADDQDAWLLSSESWLAHRAGLPNVLVLRTTGPVFSSGHGLKEISTMSHDDVKHTFALCAEVMSLIRQCPVPVVSVVQGLATAAGAQLALTADICIADGRSAVFQLPGQSIGLPCTSPSTIVSRRVGNMLTYRMSSLAEGVRAVDLPSGSIDIAMPDNNDSDVEKPEIDVLERRVHRVVAQLARGPAQPQALGKWAYWSQTAVGTTGSGGDGYEEAAKWAGRVMALHARNDDVKEGMKAFLEKRSPIWKT